MSTSVTEPRLSATRRPWHLWVVSVVMMGLYAIGARDLVLTWLHDEAYFEGLGYGPRQLAYFMDYPVVPAVFWAINIAAGLVTPVLLVARSRWAVPTVLVAATAQLILMAITFGFMGRWSVLGLRLSLTDMAVATFTLGVWLYSRVLRRRGVLT